MIDQLGMSSLCRGEGSEDLAKAFRAANDEIALTRRSASLFNCALCPRYRLYGLSSNLLYTDSTYRGGKGGTAVFKIWLYRYAYLYR
jgi:hypothetical protein